MKNRTKIVFSMLALPLLVHTFTYCADKPKDIAITNATGLPWRSLQPAGWFPLVERQSDSYFFAVGRNFRSNQTKAFIGLSQPSQNYNEKPTCEYVLSNPRRECSTYNQYIGNLSADGLKAFFAEYEDDGDELYQQRKRDPYINLTVFDIGTKAYSDYTLVGNLSKKPGTMAISRDGKWCARLTKDYFWSNEFKGNLILTINKLLPNERLQANHSVKLMLHDPSSEADEICFIEDNENDKEILVLDKSKKELFRLKTSAIIAVANSKT
jgi:hypothetical protein